MPLMLVMCFPDERPKLITPDRLTEPPDGCDGFIVTENPSGVPALAVMPCNEARPKQEQLSDYLTALACAKTYLQFSQCEGIEAVKVDQKELLLAAMIAHIEQVMSTTAEQVIRDGTLTQEVISQLCRAGFNIAHDKCCPYPVCKTDMHKRVFGSRGQN